MKVLSAALIGPDAAVHWNAHLVSRRASLPIDPLLAELYERWGVVSSAAELLSNYEHEVLKPSAAAVASAENGGSSRVVPPLPPRGVSCCIRLRNADAFVTDCNGVVVVVFSAPVPGVCGETPEGLQLASDLAAIVRCHCATVSGATDLNHTIPDAFVDSVLHSDDLVSTSEEEKGLQKVFGSPACWQQTIPLRALHKKLHTLGSVLLNRVLCSVE